HGGEPRWEQLATAGGITLVANTSLALIAAVLLWVSPLATGLLGVLALILCAAYRGYAALDQRYSSLQLLYDFTRMVNDSVRAEAVMEAMLDQACRLLRATTAEITLYDPAGVPLQWRMGEDQALQLAPSPVGDDSAAFLADVLRVGESRVVPRDSKSASDRADAERLGVRDCIVAPLRTQQGMLGTILVANRLGEVSTFDESDRRLFQTLANHAAVALENGRLIDQLRQEAAEREHEAFHDSLTGLPNRALLRHRLADAIANADGRSRVAVMLMDLDRFKDVNDTLGHHSGDLLLQQISDRLTAIGLPGTTIARLGGDEFAILLPDVANAAAAE